MPFSRTQFFDVFAAYNAALWPAVPALWLLTAVTVGAWLRGCVGSRGLSGLLAFHWLWAGIAYHAGFFSRINPAAWVFAGLFALQGGLLVWAGIVRNRLTFGRGRSGRHRLAAGLCACALGYPLLALADGGSYPRMPTFGVPCPTMLLTAGLLLAASPPIPRSVVAVPILWAGVGGSAALLLGVTPDLLLFVAGAILLLYTVRGRLLERRRAGP